MRTGPDGGAVLSEIATALWNYVTDLGRCLAVFRPAHEALSEALVERLRFTHTLFAVMEQTVGLSFEPGEAALFADTQAWPSLSVTGGDASEHPEIPPSQMVDAYSKACQLFFITQAGGAGEVRSLRTALNVCHREGFDRALRYLLALPRYGVPAWSLVESVRALLSARAATSSDGAAVDALLGVPADTVADWRFAELGGLADFTLTPGAAAEHVGTLLDAAHAVVQAARGATSCDVWFRAQLALAPVLSTVLSCVVGSDARGPRPVLDRLERIRADAADVGFFVEVDAPTSAALRPYTGWTAGTFAGLTPSEVAGLRADRAVLPDALDGRHLLTGDPGQLPVAWRALSPSTAELVTSTLGREPSELVATRPLGVSPVAALRAMMERAQVLRDEGRAAERLALLHDMHEVFPWSPNAHWELGVALDEGGRSETARQYLVTTVCALPTNGYAWRSLRVVSSRLDDQPAARLAYAVEQWLADQRRASGQDVQVDATPDGA